MQTVLIVIHLMVVAALVVVVLLQRSEGGALGMGGGGGGGGFMTGRGQANALTRATAILAGIFFLTSLGLTVLANAQRKPTSVFEDAARTPAKTVPAKPGETPAGKTSAPSLFEQLKRQDNSAAPPAPGGSASSPPAPPTAPAAGSAPVPPAGK
jgi:preprotein translocase subunit SecG